MRGVPFALGRGTRQGLEILIMPSEDALEQLLASVPTLDRDACKRELRQFPEPHLDFSDEYLDKLPLDYLRHLLLAACLQARKKQRG